MNKINLRGRKFFKLTNKAECHFGFQYKDGLNVDFIPFNKYGSCVAGGLYFSDTANILDFIAFDSTYIREITIPDDEFDVIQDPSGDKKWRSHSVICGERKSLGELATWKWMVEQGIHITNHVIYVYVKNTNTNRLEIIQYLIDNAYYSERLFLYSRCLHIACDYGNIELVKFIITHGATSIYEIKSLIKLAKYNGNVDIVKVLYKSIKYNKLEYIKTLIYAHINRLTLKYLNVRL